MGAEQNVVFESVASSEARFGVDGHWFAYINFDSYSCQFF